MFQFITLASHPSYPHGSSRQEQLAEAQKVSSSLAEKARHGNGSVATWLGKASIKWT
jgi:hypothetical protein